MLSLRIKNRTFGRIMISMSLIVVFVNEYLIYIINQVYWNKATCITGNCTRILFVADPQLLGDNNENPLYTSIAKLDSDRYLKKTFTRSFNYFEPHIICFLGDLLDEGSIATNDQYKRYVERFNEIFHTNRPVEVIHIPGDNDIGGENGEYISNSNIRRFNIEFTSKDISDYNKKIKFFKVNRMLLDFDEIKQQQRQKLLHIVISHMPVLSIGGPLTRNILNKINPNIIFSAHWHESKIYHYPSIKPIEFYGRDIIKFNLSKIKNEHKYLEIMVPTSSYRMGKSKIGYGIAVIDDDILQYSVLWTISRFVFLKFYLFWFTLLALVIIFLHFYRKFLCYGKKNFLIVR